MTSPSAAGLLARFESAETLVKAAAAARAEGLRPLDAYAPYPVPGLAGAIGFGERRMAPIALVSGLVGAAAALFMQWYSAGVDYPHMIGGKPMASWPAFLPITFETGILFAVLATVLSLLAFNGLPRPYHPVFNHPDFLRASTDGFFLLVAVPGENDLGHEGDKDGLHASQHFLEEQGAVSVEELQP